MLRGGLELRVGTRSDLPLKLDDRAADPRSGRPSSGYLDVSVPERPVAGQDPQLSG